jgi:uncharacterized protein YndB with AHSA1/START domain
MKRSVTHATFRVERRYDAAPAAVFAAWSDLEAKEQWFAGPAEWGPPEHTLDFRVGGHERNRGGPPGGPVFTFAAVYYDIVPDERIVYAYEMHRDDQRLSVSVATVEMRPAGKGTQLVVTEQGAFLDGHDSPADREHGTGILLDALGAALARQGSAAAAAAGRRRRG